jgi:hydrogenase nickel incorporation protein HypA/HybF
MHELSLMAGMMDLVRESAVQHHITHISKVKLVIGKLTMAYPHSLRFAFNTLRHDELFKDAELIIEEKETVYQCRQCQQTFAVDVIYRLHCPQCNSTAAEMISGRELFIEYYEGD